MGGKFHEFPGETCDFRYSFGVHPFISRKNLVTRDVYGRFIDMSNKVLEHIAKKYDSVREGRVQCPGSCRYIENV